MPKASSSTTARKFDPVLAGAVRYGSLRPSIPEVVHKFLDGGNLERGFARILASRALFTGRGGRRLPWSVGSFLERGSNYNNDLSVWPNLRVLEPWRAKCASNTGELRREESGSQGPAQHRRRIPTSGLDASGSGTGGTVAPGNDVDDQSTRSAAAFGQLEECPHSAPQPETKGKTTGHHGIVVV